MWPKNGREATELKGLECGQGSGRSAVMDACMTSVTASTIKCSDKPLWLNQLQKKKTMKKKALH